VLIILSADGTHDERAMPELRTWTPRHEALPPISDGAARAKLGRNTQGWCDGAAFEARLLSTSGLENERSQQQVILKLQDGRVRGWPLASFCDADRAYVASAGGSIPPPAKSTEEMERACESEHYSEDDGVLCHETAHFAFWWGHDQSSASGRRWAAAEFREMNFSYFEQVRATGSKPLHI